MASQVLSGSSNVSYTNNTGQNVRIVINYMAGTNIVDSSTISFQNISMSWAGVFASAPLAAIGRNLAFYAYNPPGVVGSGGFTSGAAAATSAANNAFTPGSVTSSFGGSITYAQGALPTELMLAPGQTFSASCGSYNIVVIPEAG